MIICLRQSSTMKKIWMNLYTFQSKRKNTTASSSKRAIARQARLPHLSPSTIDLRLDLPRQETLTQATRASYCQNNCFQARISILQSWRINPHPPTLEAPPISRPKKVVWKDWTGQILSISFVTCSLSRLPVSHWKNRRSRRQLATLTASWLIKHNQLRSKPCQKAKSCRPSR